jgi:hypothetical protein
VKTLIGNVKDPGFRKKLVVSFRLDVISFELKSPTKDNKINSVAHIKEPKKYSQFLKMNEVTL